MLVVTIGLAAAGFAFLIIALTTGSIIWAWACIAICLAGAVLLLVSALTGKRAVLPLDEPDTTADVDTPDNTDFPGNHGGSANENGEH
ncbi:hypothetical protein CJ178_08000 [Rhodococcus sp. ACPA4]|uniref:Uncharacterized protein n=2 Tax=Nocardiaceae TaxID=85025 RepID=A0A652YYH1_NOCGL|nr:MULTISPECIES: hypothetical protein [Rhodococcus]KJF19877.1 hypothetical protein SZ00_05175 [Rhodococcus sp. AD45]NMD58889.1 hypothetical protein [Nocardia globerula]NRI66168.1 hypothetical protein [Rhodococcus sp. MS16]MCE4266742.1 hypothetical protein [Rhodococcus globerulus]MDV6267445.1 hypothetical protein [Rhodococcus globerulus]